MATAAIGIDLGGTRIKGIAMDEAGNILRESVSPTQDGDDRYWKKVVVETIEQLKPAVSGWDFVTGISAPGISNESNTAIACMPGRLQGLEQFEWSAFLGHRAWVLNDAIAALVAEARLGAARGRMHVALLTLGTGVGGALLINGKPYQGAFHKAGHLGHMVIDPEGEPDVTGMPGSLEDAIGNATIAKRSGGKYQSTQELLDDYRRGNRFAEWIWLTSVRKLALGIASITNILSPELILLGGGISEAGKDLMDPLESFLTQYEWRTGGNRVIIERARFGEMAGAAGAACFAMDQVKKQMA